MKKKKSSENNNVLYVIITVLAVALVIAIAIIATKNETNEPVRDPESGENKPSNVTTKSDKISLTKIEKRSDLIVEQFELVMNNKTTNFEVQFSLHDHEGDPNKVQHLTGDLNTNDVFSMIGHAGRQDALDGEFDEAFIQTKFNENNFKFLEGEDGKRYLAMYSSDDDDAFKTTKLYILNDELQFLTIEGYGNCKGGNSIIVKTTNSSHEMSDENAWYQDTLGMCDDSANCGNEKIYTKVEANKLYHLVPVDLTSEPSGKMEERTYSIKNNKVTYRVNRTYDIVNFKGALRTC